MKRPAWMRVLLPGLAFQAVLIGGGYATGRELVAFFLPSGPAGGLLAMLVTAVAMSLTLAIVFEFSRLYRIADYQSFFVKLIGPAWIAFEIPYLLLLALVLSIVGAAAGEIVFAAFGLPKLAGTVALIGASAFFLFFGERLVARLLSTWSVVLYATFFTFLVLYSLRFGDRIAATFEAPAAMPHVLTNGISYAGLNVNCFVAVLFMMPILETRREAITSGLLAGFVAMIPGMMFFSTMMAFPAEVGKAAVPLNFLLERLNYPAFTLFFQVVILITGMKTGVGLLHALNERVALAASSRGIPFGRPARAALAVGLMIFSIVVADRIGLITLIDQGYVYLAWVFVVVIFGPIFTVGLWHVWHPQNRTTPVPTEVHA